MRIKVLLVLVFVFTGLTHNFSHAQKQGRHAIDSLLQAVANAKEDTTKVNIYISLSDNYAKYAADSGILFGKEAVLLARKLNWPKAIANGNYFLGFNYYNKSRYPDALTCFFAALTLYEQTNEIKGIANTTRKIGNVYRDQKNYTKAMECYLKALPNFERSGDKMGLARCYSNIGEIYAFENNAAEAMKFQEKSLKIYEEIDDKNGMVIAYLRMGEINVNNKNYIAGLDNKLRSLDIAENNFDKNVIAKEQLQEAYGGVGNGYLAIAKKTTNEQLPYSRDSALKSAIYYLRKAILLATEMGELIDVQTYNVALADAESLSGNYQKAFEHLWGSYQLADSLFSAKNINRITNIENQRERELKETIRQMENVRKRNEMIAVLTGFLLLLGIIVIVVRNNKLLHLEKRKSDNLLLNILPSGVAEELKAKGTTIAKYYDDVTVLFTDFVNFTQAGEQMSPQRLIDELHTCFKAFDEITSKYNIEKIKTIGDAYLAVCGLPSPDPKHAVHIVKAAIEMNAFMADRFAKLGNRTFEVRIGIHSGSVVAGIVGVKKFAYDIWGDTVNTAARMEQKSAPGKINISATTYELVKDEFNCEYRGEVEAKGKGVMKMYFVNA